MRCIKFLGIVALCSWICVEFTPLSYAQRGSLGHVGAGGGRGGGGRAGGGAHRGGGAHAQMNRAGARPHAGGGARPGAFKRWRPAPPNGRTAKSSSASLARRRRICARRRTARCGTTRRRTALVPETASRPGARPGGIAWWRTDVPAWRIVRNYDRPVTCVPPTRRATAIGRALPPAGQQR